MTLDLNNNLDDFLYDEEYAVYRHFDRSEDLEATAAVLRQHAIGVRIGRSGGGQWHDANILGSQLQPLFTLEIPASSFTKANYVLQDVAEAQLREEDLRHHPFAEYAPQELRQVLLEEHDWSPEAVVVARRLLLRSGADVDLVALRREARARQAEVYSPRPVSWLTLLLITATGIFAGLTLWLLLWAVATAMLLYYVVGTRRDGRGVRHFDFDFAGRRRGLYGFLLAVVALGMGLLNLYALRWFAFPVPSFPALGF